MPGTLCRGRAAGVFKIPPPNHPSRTAEVAMKGAQVVSTERLGSLLGHVTHRVFDDLVDPKNQGIAYPLATLIF